MYRIYQDIKTKNTFVTTEKVGSELTLIHTESEGMVFAENPQLVLEVDSELEATEVILKELLRVDTEMQHNLNILGVPAVNSNWGGMTKNHQ